MPFDLGAQRLIYNFNETDKSWRQYIIWKKILMHIPGLQARIKNIITVTFVPGNKKYETSK